MHRPLTHIRNKTLAIFFLVLFSCTEKPAQNESATEEVNILEKIKLLDKESKPVSLSDYKGKTVFLNFWATWCRPCIEEMPSIERARTKLRDQNIEFLFASNEDQERIQKFISKRKLNINSFRLENLEELNIQSLPTTFIINSSGKLVFSETGFRNWDDSANIQILTKIISSHE